ncbi:protein translocase subunit secF /protein translocase subunit secD [Pelagirhabdus alkalitolerans]|uniref:Multifunctional fusion protein n=1 Tax=Pelagirhabdus alkalitolerans TaxID=1612202 RepID=A0A1G6HQU2_9BACI|nr:protein translocase subunit SecDF [Pelagirhabdus alkalitolerans]SDB96610.1 protein translocase subunit secF /protein translocase subunit secD [Pelagirhabdus alkalitolerans]
MVKKNRLIAFFIILLTLGTVLATTSLDRAEELRLGLDLQGGVEILYEVEPASDDQEITTNVLEATVQSLRERVDVLGVSEPNFTIEEPNRIRVQLAGIENEDEAREMLQTSAELTFRDVEDNKYLDGSDLVEGGARQDFDPNTNQPIVSIQLQDGQQFGDVTREILEDESLSNQLVIWLDYEEGDSFQEEVQEEDPKFISAPQIRDVLETQNVQIDGGFTVQSAQQLADILNAGSLPVDLNEEYSQSVSAQFGLDALNETVFAGAIGILFIFIFMIAYYRFPGFISVVTLSLYIYLVIVVFGWMNGVLTLPGIAALILGVGMAVDANIITYERMKEELRTGKTMIAAYKASNTNSLSTIIDANVTTLIAATVLFIFGTSSVQGFATLLIVSIVLSFITAVFISRFLLGLWIKSRFLNNKYRWFGLNPNKVQDIADSTPIEPKVFGRRFDFVQHRKKFFTASLSLIVLGMIFLSTIGLNLSIDFTSGSRIEIDTQEEIDEDVLIDQFEEVDLEVSNLSFAGSENEIAIARIDEQLSQERVAEVRSHFNDLYDTEASINTVSPIVGQELARNAILSVIYASIFIVIYVTIRFEFYFALTAIGALLHDAFFILAIFSLTQVEFNVTIIAAILTIVGYSINDTIVTFDRIRENLKIKQRVRSFEQLKEVVNDSLMQTLARSINTVITVIFAALCLYIFGAHAITSFSFALVIGLFAGMYSSLFIAAQVWLVWRGRTIAEKPIVYQEKKRNDGPQV